MGNRPVKPVPECCRELGYRSADTWRMHTPQTQTEHCHYWDHKCEEKKETVFYQSCLFANILWSTSGKVIMSRLPQLRKYIAEYEKIYGEPECPEWIFAKLNFLFQEKRYAEIRSKFTVDGKITFPEEKLPADLTKYSHANYKIEDENYWSPKYVVAQAIMRTPPADQQQRHEELCTVLSWCEEDDAKLKEHCYYALLDVAREMEDGPLALQYLAAMFSPNVMYYRRTATVFAKKQPAIAIKCCLAGIRLFPADTTLKIRLAGIFLRTYAYQEGIEQCNAALQLRETLTEKQLRLVYFRRSKMHRELGNIKAAEADELAMQACGKRVENAPPPYTPPEK